MRELDPFDFWINHASAIEGFGGDNLSPDPRYCFHTVYVLVRPGPASFDLRLTGVRSSYGQLALRVHAFRPESGENASLVAGARLDLAAEDQDELSIRVRFAALRDVHYAFYGYFVEDADLHADTLTITLHETEGEEVEQVEPPRSVLALDLGPKDVRPANALVHVVTPRLSAPVSQDCTLTQLEELAGGVRGLPALTDWAEMIALSALRTYGVRARALEGMLVGPVSALFDQALTDAGFVLRREAAQDVPAANSTLFADVVLWPEGLWAEPDAERRWEIVRAWLGRLKIGGLGVVALRYRPERGPISSGHIAEGAVIGRNEIGKWALRLIGEGYSVAPLAFSSPEDLDLDGDGLARFALVVRRH